VNPVRLLCRNPSLLVMLSFRRTIVGHDVGLATCKKHDIRQNKNTHCKDKTQGGGSWLAACQSPLLTTLWKAHAALATPHAHKHCSSMPGVP
jgi:hypothetical protein